MLLEWLKGGGGEKMLAVALDVGMVAIGLAICAYVSLYAFKVYIRIAFRARTRKWRKNPKVGDVCFFYNALGGVTMCTIDELAAKHGDTDKVLVSWSHGAGGGVTWHSLKNLHYLTQEERDSVQLHSLAKALTSLKGKV